MTDVPDAGMLREYNEIAKRLEELADQESMPEKGELARRVARLSAIWHPMNENP